MFLAFGEIMMRVAPEGRLRLRQAMPGKVDITFAGGEANVCASLALFGAGVRYVTALPKHAIAESLVAVLRGLGVDTGSILWRDAGRLGIYFLETGANQRSSVVLYDRDGSAIALAAPDEYDFPAALDGVTWVHITGITPALSENAYLATLRLVQLAKERGASVSCDLNFRKKLWRWRAGATPNQLANECMSTILPCVDLVVANEEDAADVLGIHAKGTSVEQGRINARAYEAVARTIVDEFPNVSRVAITLRESLSADHNNWGGMLFDVEANRAFFAPLDAGGGYQPYEIRDIVDRVGGGDSFAAGLLYALNSKEYAQPAMAIRFAVAASCLKHSIQGDFNLVTRDEVAALLAGAASGRVRR
ncbi:MAG TPA: sugar kinase [Planctomycetota bacterium]|nr:sugar kinase [Planctomycetota bacterium]HRR80865.1 sugar kinase [Planctomycetota bacterium]HRT94728.1 sugar kinase [Planctomycetota bacterium]